MSLLYIFWFLHQTTTIDCRCMFSSCCISFDSYIKPQLGGLSYDERRSCISFDSYIKPQLVGLIESFRCVVYLLIPTSNHNLDWVQSARLELYIFWFLHQTTTAAASVKLCVGCISFDSYIKPQLGDMHKKFIKVVYLLIPTSNHNMVLWVLGLLPLYIFWFLHQTTTVCYILFSVMCCISFDSYIKPQPYSVLVALNAVVYLLIPTSNHNSRFFYLMMVMLYIFWFLHQTTTHNEEHNHNWELYIFWFLHQTTTYRGSEKDACRCISFDSYIKPQLWLIPLISVPSCISFDSYIKPQPSRWIIAYFHVVYLLIPTSNHNL